MRNFTIGKRVGVGFAAVIAVTVALGGLSVVQLNRITAQAEGIDAESLPGLSATGRLLSLAKDCRGFTYQHLLAKDQADMAKAEARLADIKIKIDAAASEYTTIEKDEAPKRVLAEALTALAAFRESRAHVLTLNREGKRDEARALFAEQSLPLFEQMIGKVQTLVEMNTEESHGDTSAIKATCETGRWVAGIGLATAVVLCTGLGFLIVRGVGKALTRMSSTLGEASGQVASAATQVSSASQSLAQGASEQASSLEETSSALEEITSMTKKNADTARQASALSAQAKAAGDKGNEAMGKMGVAIGEIERSASETAKIIKVIDEIAFQTNLLALNAAVEAARAGEAGKGFAVVAEEVRNLAMRSAEAAKTTGAMIERSVANARNGVEISSEVAKTLAEITSASGRVNALVGEIAAASNEQAQGVSQINNSVSQMDKVTQGTAAGAEQAAAASEELSAQAAEMSATVNELVALVKGAAEAGSRPAPAFVARRPAAGPSLSARLADKRPAAKRPAPKPAAARPEDAIPFGDAPAAAGKSSADDAFADFNG